MVVDWDWSEEQSMLRALLKPCRTLLYVLAAACLVTAPNAAYAPGGSDLSNSYYSCIQMMVEEEPLRTPSI